MFSVALTGGIAAGKSLVARRLRELGATLIDADVIAREVVAPGTDGLAAIVEAFGQQVLTPDGALDRPALARRVFAEASARERLNSIVHPLVRAEADRRLRAAAPDAVVVQDIPLLAETGQSHFAFDLVIVVEAPEALRIERMIRDRGMSADEAARRIAAQATDAQRRAIADVVVPNAGTEREVLAAVDHLWETRLAHRR